MATVIALNARAQEKEMSSQSSITGEEIHNRFHYHKPSEEGAATHQILSAQYENLAHVIDQTCPEGREKSLAMTSLETSKFWASAAVARNPDTR
jgi:hypothetical protein